MRQCIYCTKRRPKRDFNVDHVVPRQLGQFHTNSPTLTAVCRECNKHFGDGIERLLGRDSYEGLMRLVCGIKPPSGAREFRGDRTEFRIPDGSSWEGVRLRLGESSDQTHVVMDLPSQIGIRHQLGPKFRYFLEAEFAGSTDAELDIQPGSQFRLLAPDEHAYLRLEALIRKRVPGFQIEGPVPPPPAEDDGITVEITATVDKELARAVAKIGFNYLAHVAGAEFVLAGAFDAVREFIRYGTGERRHFVTLRTQPILSNESTRYRITQGHLVVVEWHQDTRAVRARVSPFNGMTYEVALCRDFAGVWRPIESGHLFDWEGGEVIPLASLRRSFSLAAPPPIIFPP